MILSWVNRVYTRNSKKGEHHHIYSKTESEFENREAVYSSCNEGARLLCNSQLEGILMLLLLFFSSARTKEALNGTWSCSDVWYHLCPGETKCLTVTMYVKPWRLQYLQSIDSNAERWFLNRNCNAPQSWISCHITGESESWRCMRIPYLKSLSTNVRVLRSWRQWGDWKHFLLEVSVSIGGETVGSISDCVTCNFHVLMSVAYSGPRPQGRTGKDILLVG